jgi:hypothetical protein
MTDGYDVHYGARSIKHEVEILALNSYTTSAYTLISPGVNQCLPG